MKQFFTITLTSLLIACGTVTAKASSDRTKVQSEVSFKENEAKKMFYIFFNDSAGNRISLKRSKKRVNPELIKLLTEGKAPENSVDGEAAPAKVYEVSYRGEGKQVKSVTINKLKLSASKPKKGE